MAKVYYIKQSNKYFSYKNRNKVSITIAIQRYIRLSIESQYFELSFFVQQQLEFRHTLEHGKLRSLCFPFPKITSIQSPHGCRCLH